MRETHQVHCEGCRNDNTFHDFNFMTTEFIFFLQVQAISKVSKTYCFVTHIHSLSQNWRKAVTNVILPYTFILLLTAAMTPTPMAYFWNFNGVIGQTHRCPPLLSTLSLWMQVVVSQMVAMAKSEGLYTATCLLLDGLGLTEIQQWWRRFDGTWGLWLCIEKAKLEGYKW